MDDNVVPFGQPPELSRPKPPELEARQRADLARQQAARDSMGPMGYAVGGAALGGVGAMFLGYPGWLGAVVGGLAGYGYGRF